MALNVKSTLHYILESPRMLAHNIYTSSKAFFTSFSFSSTRAANTEYQKIAFYKATLSKHYPDYHKESTSSLYVAGILELYRDIVKDLYLSRKKLTTEHFVFDKKIKELLVIEYTDQIKLYTESYVNPLKEKLAQCKKKDDAQLLENKIEDAKRALFLEQISEKTKDIAEQNQKLKAALEKNKLEHTTLEKKYAALSKKYTELETSFKDSFQSNAKLKHSYTELYQHKETLEKRILHQNKEMQQLRETTVAMINDMSKRYNNSALHKRHLSLEKKNATLTKVHTVKEDLVQKSNQPVLANPKTVSVTPRNLTTQVTNSSSVPITPTSDDIIVLE